MKIKDNNYKMSIIIYNKYNNSCLYKIYCKDSNVKEFYIGSTENFKERRKKHKTRCINPNDDGHNIYVYRFMRQNGGWENFIMEKIMDIWVYTEKEKLQEERKWWDLLKPTLNDRKPYVTKLEKKEYDKEKSKKYYKKNKSKIRKRSRENYAKKKLKTLLINKPLENNFYNVWYIPVN